MNKEYFVTYEILQKRNPIALFSNSLQLPERFIEEIYYICENDIRFQFPDGAIEYKKLQEYIETFWQIKITKRRLRYIHLVIKNHRILEEKLKRGAIMNGSYRDLVLRKA